MTWDYPISSGGSGFGSGLPSNFVSKTTTYVASANDFVEANATGGGFTVTLPTSPATGALVAVKKMDASGNVVTVTPGGGGTIDGQATATIVTQYAGAVLEHVGANVWVVATVMNTAGPVGPTGPIGPVGGSGVQPMMAAGVVGAWYQATGAAPDTKSNRNITVGTLVLGTAYVAPQTITIDALGCYVQTAGSAGSVVRFGIYLPTAPNPYTLLIGSPYATLLVDGGTATATAGATPATVTLGTPQVIVAGTPFCVGVVPQVGGTVGIYCEATTNPPNSPWGSNSILNGANMSVVMTSITGALPATFTPSAYQAATIGGCGWFRRSA